VTFESVLSGPGLARLYAALRTARGLHILPRAAPEIETAAKGGEDAATETLRLFWRLAARCAGDLALAFLARGGVTLGGGVLPRLVDWLDVQDFRQAFESKAPMTDLARSMPVRLLMEPDAALAGLAALGAKPETYAIDYASRAWR
jgi:glucokinase